MTSALEVIVIGGANIDIKAKSSGALISGTSNPGDVCFAPGGVARNIAYSLARLDVPAALITAVGADDLGDRLLAETEAAGVDCSMVLRTGQPTGSYVAILDAQGELAFAVNAMSAMEKLTPAVLVDHEERLEAARLILADCNLPVVSLVWLTRFRTKLVVELVSVAKAERAHELRGLGVFALTLNRRQAEQLCGSRIGSIADAINAAAALNEQGFERVILTLGPLGAVVSQKDGGSAHVEAFAGIACDVTGAGDAAAAGLIFGLVENFDLVTTARLGQAAASLVIGKMQSVSPDLSRARLLSLTSSRMDGR